MAFMPTSSTMRLNIPADLQSMIPASRRLVCGTTHGKMPLEWAIIPISGVYEAPGYCASPCLSLEHQETRRPGGRKSPRDGTRLGEGGWSLPQEKHFGHALAGHAHESIQCPPNVVTERP